MSFDYFSDIKSVQYQARTHDSILFNRPAGYECERQNIFILTSLLPAAGQLEARQQYSPALLPETGTQAYTKS